jgi:gluconolactonase
MILAALLVTSTPAIYAAPPGQEETTYTVQSGDSLWMLAEKYLGSGNSFPAIVEATNQMHQTDDSFANITDPGLLLPGMKLLIPAGTGEPATMPEPAPAPAPAGEMVPEIVASADDIVVDNLNFPEAPYWSTAENRLYFLEWGGDTIWTMQDGQAALLLDMEPGDGPSGIFQDQAGNLWVTLYSSLKVVQMTPEGEILQTFDNYEGAPFRGPNDLVIDAAGGVYFTDSGNFEEDWTEGRAVGAVYYITPEGELQQVDSELVYPNGIFLSLDGSTLYVDEHRQNRILSYGVNGDGTWSGPEVFFEPDDTYVGSDPEYSYELGPDGMWRDSQGNLWVAHYGGGKVMVISPAGELLRQIILPGGVYPTNTTLSPDEKTLYVTESGAGSLYQIPLE